MAKLHTTSAPPSTAVPYASKLSKVVRQNLGTAIWSTLSDTMGARSDYDEQLIEWNRIYEMQVEEKDFPWPDCSNIRLPYTATQLDTLAARLAAVVYVPRLYLFEGNTPEAQESQHDVEQYYNAGLNRYGRRKALFDYLQLGLRDGVAAMDVTWRKTKAKRRFVMQTEVMENGAPAIDWETGEPKTKPQQYDIMVTEYDDYELKVVESKDLIVVPNEAETIESAMLTARRMLIDEATLMAMCETGDDGSEPELWEEEVQLMLADISAGRSEITEQGDSTDTYTAGGLLSVTGTIGTPVDGIKQFDRVASVFRCYTRAYDIDGDKWPEEAVAWVHENTGRLIGLSPYKYLHRRRSLVAFTPFPRGNRYLGFSLVGRLQPIQNEMDGTHNERNDQKDLRLSPPRYRKDGVRIDKKNDKWGPDAEYVVESKDDIGIIQLPPIPPDSLEQEMLLASYGQQYTGLSAPMTGAPNPSKRSAKEVNTQAQSSGIRVDLIAAELRAANREILEQIHALTLQFGPDTMSAQGIQENGRPMKLTIDKAKLAQDYAVSVAGFGAPLDQEARTTQRMFVHNLLAQDPDVANDTEKRYYLNQYVLESTSTGDLTKILGTAQEAKQRGQQQAQQAQQMQQFQQKLQLLQAQHGMSPTGQHAAQGKAHAPAQHSRG